MQVKQYCCEMISISETNRIIYYDNIESAVESICKGLELSSQIEGKIYAILEHIEPILIFKKVVLP